MAVATSMPIKTEQSSLLMSPAAMAMANHHSPRKWPPRISLCVGCGSEIYDQYILRVSPDLEWHASCLKCADCQQYLDESCTCFVRDGKTYCKRDYLRLFGAKCAKCSMCFSKTDLVMRARNKIYHVECFRCAVCARQLTRGDEFVLKFDDLFCKADHDVVTEGKIVVGSCLSSSNNSSSNVSTVSSSSTSSTSSLTPLTPVTPECGLLKDGPASLLVGLTGSGPPPPPPPLPPSNSSSSPTHHLTVLNSVVSNGGGGSLPPATPQMPLHPAGVIPGPGGDLNGHMNSSNISPSGGAGAPTHLSALSAVQMDHHTSLTATAGLPPSQSSSSSSSSSSMTPANVQNVPPPSSTGTSSASNRDTGDVRNTNSSSSSGGGHHHQHHHRSSHRSMHHSSKNPDHKPTRVRTVLNEKQLHTLRSCYNANPRPDALMKEQLVEMTGLSPRVIRVWFQNKRCKDKKRSILMKQMQQQEKDGRQLSIGQMRGVPLIATSPVRHDSPVHQINPIDVHSYQPPWKALADYASMQPDIDPQAPQFQHLVSQMHGYSDGMTTPNDASMSSLGHGGGPPTGPCTPMSYLADQDIHQPASNMSSDMSSPCTSE